MNKPVAWIHETELQDGTTVKRVTGAWELKYRYIVDSCDRGNPIPLYTHPAKLTDEEIISTMVQFDVYSNDDQCLIEAGRAILRKAQEK